jgi:hypothetical protein
VACVACVKNRSISSVSSDVGSTFTYRSIPSSVRFAISVLSSGWNDWKFKAVRTVYILGMIRSETVNKWVNLYSFAHVIVLTQIVWNHCWFKCLARTIRVFETGSLKV